MEHKNTKNKTTDFTLKSVVFHSGGQKIDAGHYVALINENNNWYLYDDTNEPRNVNIKNYIYTGYGRKEPIEENAYILFYEKISS